MDLPGPIHDFLLVFLGSGLILGGLGVILFTNPIFSAFSLGLVLVCISLFYILANSQFVASAQLLIYVGAINVLIIFAVMFINGLEYDKNFRLWTLGDGITLLVCTSIFVFLIVTIFIGSIELRLLLEIADAGALGDPGLAVIFLVEAGHDPEQRRLAGAVDAEHADLGVRIERQMDVIEHLAGRVALVRPCMK